MKETGYIKIEIVGMPDIVAAKNIFTVQSFNRFIGYAEFERAITHLKEKQSKLKIKHSL